MAAGPAHSPDRPYRILVVDEEPLVRLGLGQLLAGTPDLILAGEAASAAEARAQVQKSRPDLILAEIDLRGRSGLDLAREIRAQFRRVRVLILSHLDPRLYTHRAIEAGAAGFVGKNEDVAVLLDSIRTVLKGGQRLPPGTAAPDIPGGQVTALSTLTAREFEVFRLVGQGCNSAEIAQRLCISAKTVEAHRDNLKRKLGLRSATALNLLAIRWTAGR